MHIGLQDDNRLLIDWVLIQGNLFELNLMHVNVVSTVFIAHDFLDNRHAVALTLVEGSWVEIAGIGDERGCWCLLLRCVVLC